MWLGWLMRGTATYQAWDAARGVANDEDAGSVADSAGYVAAVLASLPRIPTKESQIGRRTIGESDEQVYVVLSSQLEALRRCPSRGTDRRTPT